MARRAPDANERGILSETERNGTRGRTSLTVVRWLVLLVLLVTGLGPLLWLAKAAVTPIQDTLGDPLAVFPSGQIQWDNIARAWSEARIGLFLGNSAAIAAGTVVLTLLVSLSAAYVLSVLRPRWAPLLSGAILATVLIPGVISLVPLYLTVLDVPLLGLNLLNSYWAIWLPTSANAVAVLVVKRFFDAIPRDLFDAARIDGAGAVRVFFSIVLPLSRPVIGVVALLTAVASWKDFLWPLIVISDASKQPVSVALARLADSTSLDVQLAAMLLALLVPVGLFLAFQGPFFRGVGASGGIKQ